MLALFSAVSYTAPRGTMDLAAHLTNTSLQVERGEAGVRLMDELVGCNIFGGESKEDSDTLSADDLEDIKTQMVDILGETFNAALSMSVHFQVRS